MKTPLIDRGSNITYLQQNLLNKMDSEDASRLVDRAKELIAELPDIDVNGQNRIGLLLGLIQSGKTSALTTGIALAADNGYRMFIVLTTDNNWLYDQTLGRLKNDLQKLQIESKTTLEGTLLWPPALSQNGAGLVLVVSKNQTKLRDLLKALEQMKAQMGGSLPNALVIDDEADQASLDTQTSKRAKQPTIPPGRINTLITEVRTKFQSCTYLQVTATPQALFLQDRGLYRPEFTILVEPGKGYIGGNNFFSLQWGRAEDLIRYVPQADLDQILTSNDESPAPSLRKALATFFVGATIKCLLSPTEQLKFSFLCHISQKKSHHQKAYNAIMTYRQQLLDGLVSTNETQRNRIEQEFRAAYDDLVVTLNAPQKPAFQEVFEEFTAFINGMEIQVLNSDKDEPAPKYDRRYNIYIGGTKLSRGVTIDNLIVTYYGRQAKTTNMDTVLQHARMYGYREPLLDVTRLFVTAEIEDRFRLINESEQGLRKVIETYPNEQYRVIRIGKGLNATRRNVLNPNNKGYFGAGSSTFPHRPMYKKEEVATITQELDNKLDALYPNFSDPSEKALPITVDQIVEIIRMTRSEPNGGGLWDTERVITALETLRADPTYGNAAYLAVRKNRDIGKNPQTGTVRAVLSGGEEDRLVTNKKYPTLFMFRLTGSKDKEWDDAPFWIPILRFPDGQFALEFNITNTL